MQDYMHFGRKRVSIKPGEWFVTKDDVIITTLLGSCVSACLFDPVRKVAGMNHFLLSNNRYSQTLPICETEAGKYGIQSMELLMKEMRKLGASRNNMKAKAFGGAKLMTNNQNAGNFLCVGEINVRFIKEFLMNQKIPLISSDLGRKTGRVIFFDTQDYSVKLKELSPDAEKDIRTRDKSYWESSLQQ